MIKTFAYILTMNVFYLNICLVCSTTYTFDNFLARKVQLKSQNSSSTLILILWQIQNRRNVVGCVVVTCVVFLKSPSVSSDQHSCTVATVLRSVRENNARPALKNNMFKEKIKHTGV